MAKTLCQFRVRFLSIFMWTALHHPAQTAANCHSTNASVSPNLFWNFEGKKLTVYISGLSVGLWKLLRRCEGLQLVQDWLLFLGAVLTFWEFSEESKILMWGIISAFSLLDKHFSCLLSKWDSVIAARRYLIYMKYI